jgi:MbtH protein
MHRYAGYLPIHVGRHSLANEEQEQFVVVINAEEQYSIWPEYKAIPAGWSQVGKAASKDVCLEAIKTLWTDMRPLSLRRQMEAQQS